MFRLSCSVRARLALGKGLLAGLVAAGLAIECRATTFVVSNINDSGPGSLRQAMVNANLTNPPVAISFQIPGAGAHTIAVLSALPSVLGPVQIDGTTQPGYAVGQPVIELNGAGAGASVGLRLSSSFSVVRGLVINGFGGGGVRIDGPGSNTVAGCFIGTDATGTTQRANAAEGIYVFSSTGNVIGGTNAADRNVISGNGDAGIYLQNSVATLVVGNYLGMAVGGAARLGNGNSGIICYSASQNIIGGVAPGAPNLISGNGGSGIFLLGLGSVSNLIQGNLIGTDLSGSVVVGNAGDGITMSGGAGNRIGGTAAGAANLICGNAEAGIYLLAGATNNVMEGNYVGLSGRLALGNNLAGIILSAAGGNTIGGAASGARNLISGNKQDGVLLLHCAANTIQGNWIGLDTNGMALSNGFNGLTLNAANSNLVGGLAAGAGNVISGNGNYGVQVFSGATGNLVQGNWVGTGVAGTTVVSNGLSGICIQSAGNTVGGVIPAARNLISGNGDNGVFLVGATATGNLVAGNYIGTDTSGKRALGNTQTGIGLSDAPSNTIGGAVSGAGNLISGNHAGGLYVVGSAGGGNVIQGNIIGADVTGQAALGNAYEGILVQDASGNLIGGATAAARNLISGNFARGVWLTNASWNVIQGNYIGTQSDGQSALGNVFHGIDSDVGANNNLIGGAVDAGNRIAFAQGQYAGVRIRDGSTNNAILSNAIFSNGPYGGLGIDLGDYGVNPNLPCDPQGGANEAQNYPVLAYALTPPNASVTIVQGSLNSRPSASYHLQFFANLHPDSSGFGEGQFYLGDASVATGSDCNASFVATLANPAPVGYFVTATATDAANNTSEFSADVTVISSLLSIAHIQSSPNAGLLLLSWPGAISNTVTLEETASLRPPVSWTASTNVPVLTSGQWVVTEPSPKALRFYRLKF